MTTKKIKAVWEDFIDVKKPILINKWAETLQKYVRPVYLIAIVILGVLLLMDLLNLLKGNLSAALLGFILIVIDFIIIRMFAEFLLVYKKK